MKENKCKLYSIKEGDSKPGCHESYFLGLYIHLGGVLYRKMSREKIQSACECQNDVDIINNRSEGNNLTMCDNSHIVD